MRSTSVSRGPTRTRRSLSSKRTDAQPSRSVRGFHRVHGRTCFCPLSAIAANHHPRRGAASHARISGFSPFVAVTSPSCSSKSTERLPQRIASLPSAGGRAGQGENRAQIATHASQTCREAHERTRPGVVVSLPDQSA